MRQRALASLTSVVAALTACDGRPAGNDTTLVRDSAGVRIVENATPRSADSWAVGEPLLSIGVDSADEATQLYQVVGALRTRDGVTLVANGGSNAILRFSPSGEYVGSTGGPGEGPGRFRTLTWFGRGTNDSLVVWDRGLGRVTILAPDGTFVRQYQPTLPENPMTLVVRGQIGEHRLLVSRDENMVSTDGDAGIQRQPVAAWLTTESSGEVVQFGPFPGAAVYINPDGPSGRQSRTPVPYGAATLIKASREYVYVADNASYDIKQYNPDGNIERIIRRPHAPLRVEPADLEAEIQERLKPLPPIPQVRERAQMALEAVPAPEFIPPVRSIQIDVEGCIWVESGRHVTAPATSWSVFDQDGNWLADVTVSADFEPLDIGSTYILGKRLGEFDVESIEVLELKRPAEICSHQAAR